MKWLKNFERLLEIQRNVVWPGVMEMEPKQESINISTLYINIEQIRTGTFLSDRRFSNRRAIRSKIAWGPAILLIQIFQMMLGFSMLFLDSG